MSYGPKPWLQRHWDARAAANFMLGGSGAGLAVAGVASDSPALMPLALAMVGLGLAAVWLEIGRKLRAAHVFFNPQTSWMTRESYAAILLFAFGVAGFFRPEPELRILACVAALAFLGCQAAILRAAKGIPAWRAPQVIALVMTTALAEGAGILVFFQADASVLSFLAIAVVARGVAWSRYWSALKQPASRAALAPAGKVLVQLGTVAPLALLLAALFAPQAALLAGSAALAAGWRLKYVLVARAAFNQGFSLQHLPAR
jgi:phenylacetyl-CoA:acceptor oxidoreductase subunit 2